MLRTPLEKKKEALYTVSQDDSTMDKDQSSEAEEESQTGWSEGHESSSSSDDDEESESSTTISQASSSDDSSDSDNSDEDETEEGDEEEKDDGKEEKEEEEEEEKSEDEGKEEEEYDHLQVVESSTDSDEESTSTTVSVEEISKTKSPQVVAKGTYEMEEEEKAQPQDKWGFSLLGKKKSFESADSGVLEIIEEPATTDEDEPARKGGLFGSMRRNRSKEKVDNLKSDEEGETTTETDKKSIFRGFGKKKNEEADSPGEEEKVEVEEENTPSKETQGLFSSLRRSKKTESEPQDDNGKLGIEPREDVDMEIVEKESSEYGTPKQGKDEDETTPVKQRRSIFASFGRRKKKDTDTQAESTNPNAAAEADIESGQAAEADDVEVADAPAISRKRGLFHSFHRNTGSDDSPEIVLPVDVEGGTPESLNRSRAAGRTEESDFKVASTGRMSLRRMFLLLLLFAIVVSVSTIGTSYYGSKLALENAGVAGRSIPVFNDACPDDNVPLEFTIAFDNRPDEVGLSLRDSTLTGQAFWLFQPGSFRTLAQINRENTFFVCLNSQNSYTFEITDTANNGLVGLFAGTPVYGSWKLSYDGFIVATYDGNCNGTDVNDCGAFCACDFQLRFNETRGGCRTDCPP